MHRTFYVVEIEPETGIVLARDGKRARGDAHWYPFDSQALAEAFCAGLRARFTR